MACSAAWSFCLSADEPAVESSRGAALVPGEVEGVEAVRADKVGAGEQPAIRRTTTTRPLATWGCLRRRRDCDRPNNARVTLSTADIRQTPIHVLVPCSSAGQSPRL